MAIDIIDVHSVSQEGLPAFDLLGQIVEGLTKPVGEKQLPSLLLYDEQGLKLYDDLTTTAPEYYLFAAENEILENHADQIVQTMHAKETSSSDEVVLELGAGALRKTSHILTGLARFVEHNRLESPITYYALDLEKLELERTLKEIDTSIGSQLHGKVVAKGLCATYDEGLKFAENGGLATRPQNMHIMFLGSSLGNFSREDAVTFLRNLPLRASSGDTLLLGLDHDNDKDQIEKAYNDPKGFSKRFALNILRSTGRTLGDESMFRADKWEYANLYDNEHRKREAYLKAKCQHSVQLPSNGNELKFRQHETVKIAESVKYSNADACLLFQNSHLRPIRRWVDSRGQYSLWLLERL